MHWTFLKIQMLIKVQMSEIRDSIGAHHQIVARQIQGFQATLRQSVSLRELAATSYLRECMNLMIALATYG